MKIFATIIVTATFSACTSGTSTSKGTASSGTPKSLPTSATSTNFVHSECLNPPFGPPANRVGPLPESARDDIHFLLSNHSKIKRTVTPTQVGVETETRSSDPKVAEAIKRHVAAMKRRSSVGGRVRPFDPLFRKLTERYQDMNMSFKEIDSGVTVVNKGIGATGVSLVKAHADVVSAFVKHGFDEARRCHDIPMDVK